VWKKAPIRGLNLMQMLMLRLALPAPQRERSQLSFDVAIFEFLNFDELVHRNIPEYLGSLARGPDHVQAFYPVNPIDWVNGDAPKDPPLLTSRYLKESLPLSSSNVSLIFAPIAARFDFMPTSFTDSQ
jgi:hypothetical protein